MKSEMKDSWKWYSGSYLVIVLFFFACPSTVVEVDRFYLLSGMMLHVMALFVGIQASRRHFYATVAGLLSIAALGCAMVGLWAGLESLANV